MFNHGFSLYTQEVHVPLLIISATAPAGRTVSEPVSLRNLPATVVNLLGLGAGSPFPGRSLAENWRPTAGAGERRTSPAFSEVDIPIVIIPQRGRGPNQRGFTTSLVAEGLHYLLDIRGTEELYDLAADPREVRDLKKAPERTTILNQLRNAMALIIRDNRAPGGVAAAYQKQLMTLLGSMLPRTSLGSHLDGYPFPQPRESPPGRSWPTHALVPDSAGDRAWPRCGLSRSGHHGLQEILLEWHEELCQRQRFPLERPGRSRGPDGDPGSPAGRGQLATAEADVAAPRAWLLGDACDLGRPAADAALWHRQLAPGRRTGPGLERPRRGVLPAPEGGVVHARGDARPAGDPGRPFNRPGRDPEGPRAGRTARSAFQRPQRRS